MFTSDSLLEPHCSRALGIGGLEEMICKLAASPQLPDQGLYEPVGQTALVASFVGTDAFKW